MGLIEKYGLSEKEVQEIVKEWYSNGMTPDIFQNEDSVEVDEYCDDIIYSEVWNFEELGYKELIESRVYYKDIKEFSVTVQHEFFKDIISITVRNNKLENEKTILTDIITEFKTIRDILNELELDIKNR